MFWMFWKFLPVMVMVEPAVASPGVIEAIAGLVAALMLNTSFTSLVVPFFRLSLKPVPAQAAGTDTAMALAFCAANFSTVCSTSPGKVMLATRSRSVPLMMVLSPAVMAAGVQAVTVGLTNV